MEEQKEGAEPIVSKEVASELANSMKNEISSLPYTPSSTKCNPTNAYTPTKLYYETQQALRVFVDMGIDTTTYVKNKLKYNSELAVCKVFSAEQVDAIALAIYQIEENNQSFILGDGTGIGKGRVCAGLLRYAHQKGLIPMFITLNTSLFSSQYRDISDIGGFDSDNLMPRPFILNGCGSKSFSEDLRKDVYDSDIILNGEIIFRSKTKKENIEELKKGVMPIGYDLILSTYSAFSQDTGKTDSNTGKILNFLFEKQEELFLIMDESHSAAGSGYTNQNLSVLTHSKSKIIFSSATFAKRFENLEFYINKTAIADAGVTNDQISTFVDNFKENALEFVSQGLAQTGQYIRRELSLDGCDVNYSYQPEMKQDQWDKYDALINLLNKIAEFTKTTQYAKALELTIIKIIEENKLPVPSSPKPTGAKDVDVWKKANYGKYTYTLNLSSTLKNKNIFIENLLFALKADFVADKAIENLSKKYKYINKKSNGDIDIVETNIKPLITVRNTGESSLTFDKSAGEALTPEEADFSYNLISVLNESINGKIIFTKIAKEAEKETLVFPLVIDLNDFNDKGASFNSIMTEIRTTQSGLCISPLDAIIDKIQTHQREAWDYDYNKNPFYVIEDTTKRTKKIVKKDGVWYFAIKPSEKNDLKIARFNSGLADTIIINVSAATGESFHSSERFIDKRRRSMLIHQVELDVAVEMQKLGRVNRNGQVNYPSYEYVVSMIPSEIRRLMALKKKLRSLSASSTGNMNQTASYTEITDKNKNPFEDIFTKYGYDVLMTVIDEKPEFSAYMPNFDSWFDSKISPEGKLEQFSRCLEIAPAEVQDTFYEMMNRLYKDKRIAMMKNLEWDLDSNIINYKASIKNQSLLFSDSGKNIFCESVYIQDVYVTNQNLPLTKEEVEEEKNKLCKGKKHNEFYKTFVSELKNFRDESFKNKLATSLYDTEVDSEGQPLTKEGKEEVRILNEGILHKITEQYKEMYDWMIKVIGGGVIKGTDWGGLTIGKQCKVPFDVKSILELAKDDDDYEKKLKVPYSLAIFLGYKIDSKESGFLPSNITACFAVLDGINAELRIKPTRTNRAIFEDFIVPYTNRMHAYDITTIDNWKVVTKPRILIKTITGNLLRANTIVDAIIEVGDNIRVGSYTTIDGGVEKGVILKSMKHTDLPKISITYVPCNKESVVDSGKFYYFSDGLSYLLYGTLTIFSNSYDKANKYKSKYADLIEQLKEFADKKNILNTTLYKVRRRHNINKFQSEKTVEVDVYEIRYTQDVADLFYTLTKEVVQENGATMIYGEEDKMKSFTPTSSSSSPKGVYLYTPENKFGDSNKPPYFIEFITDSTYRNGIVKTEYELSPLERASFKMLPIEMSLDASIKELIAKLVSNKKIEELVNFAKGKPYDYVQIAMLANKLAVIYLKYFFGNLPLAQIGEALSAKINNKELPSSFFEESKEEEEAQEDFKSEIPLNIETAQDFLIKFRV